MRMIFKVNLALLLVIAASFSLHAQNRFFNDVIENTISAGDNPRVLIPRKYRTIQSNTMQLRDYLWSLPSEQNVIRSQAPILELPTPDGGTARFRVWESSIQEQGLEAKFPEIKTFAGQGIDDPYATIRFDYSPYFGFHAQILTVNGTYYIDPYARGNIDYYISYFDHDNIRNAPFVCHNTDMSPQQTGSAGKPQDVTAGPCRGTELYTYRLAVACTGEYAVAVGGVTPGALHAAIVTTVNRVDGVYENELAVRLILIADNDQIEYMDASSDPFSGNNNAGILIGESQSVITTVIGSANFDIGHTFSTGGGGLAGLNVVCNTSNKARGITGSSFPIGDGYDIDYVAHEIGHQFGGSHTWNGCGGGGGTSSSYEVGSGTTIQAYAGICGSDNLQPNSDPYFHTRSFDQIGNFINAGGFSCKGVINTGNTLPQITAMNNNGVNIPIATPFTLTATATDADGDALTYNWEQWDLGPGGSWNSGASSTTAPLFKSRIPKTSGSRTFPDMAVILAGYPSNPPATMGGLKGETLPQVGRALKFRLTVRDNRAGGGGIVTGGDGCQTGFTGIYQINTISGTGPFVVTSPNGGESYAGGTLQNITWNVAGTNAAPINTANVRITLSTDGGLTYPNVVIASTPNDGSEMLPIPAIVTSQARVRIEAVDNVYFDISNNNFSITAAASGFDFDNPAGATVACDGPTSSSIVLGTTSTGGFSTPIDLSASGVPAGATVTFSQDPVTPGNNTTVTLNNTNALSAGIYNITITGVAGTMTKSRVLSFTVQTGTGPTITSQPSAQVICAGDDATFNVVASGTATYQWQLSTDGGNNFINIAGATSPTFVLNAASPTQNNFIYRVLVIGQCNTATSNEVLLTVNTGPSVSAHPQSLTLCTGSNATFTTTATGGGLTYQWQVSTDGGANYSPLPGATTSSYTANNITAGMNNNRYRVIITGTCAPSATTNAATLTVISPVIVTNDADDVTICETGNVSFSVAGNSSVPIIYQWQVSTDDGNNYSNISNGGVYSGATTSTLNITNVTAAMDSYRYRALLSNATCTNPTVSNTGTPAILTVNARPTVTLSASPTSLTPGMSTTITANIQPSSAGFDINWFRNNTVIAGANSTTYTADVTTLGDYKVTIVNTTTGCNNESQVLSITAEASERLFIYPSPNNGRFTIAYFNSGASTSRNVAVYDARGALVFQNQFAIGQPYQLLPVNIQFAASGIYMVILRDAEGNKIITGKVMVSHH